MLAIIMRKKFLPHQECLCTEELWIHMHPLTDKEIASIKILLNACTSRYTLPL